MIYLDYTANYPVKKEVLEAFCNEETKFYGNANSLHQAGSLAKEEYLRLLDNITSLLGLDKEKQEVILTSSATESNNMVIKGLFEAYSGTSSTFLSSEMEHSSVNGTLAYLKDKGANVELIKTDRNGQMDFSDFEKKASTHPLLTCLTCCESETGTIQDYLRFQRYIRENDLGFLLLDATQAIGKIPLALKDVDFVSFAPHKFGGLLGSGILIKRRDVVLTPLLHGGKSISLYRSSTPCLGLLASVECALRLALSSQEENFKKVSKLRDRFLKGIEKNKKILVNSFLENPYIINISYDGKKASSVVEYLSSCSICVSQKSACSITATPSKVINSIYHDRKRASESFRISLSDLTTEEEIDTLIKRLEEL